MMQNDEDSFQKKGAQVLNRIVQRLIDQQITYITHLKTVNFVIQQQFMKKNILNDEELKYVFGELPIIIQFHYNFMIKLQGEQKVTEDVRTWKFSSQIKHFIQFLQIYNEYISRIPHILHKLQEINSRDSSQINSIQQFYELKFQIQDYFLLPLKHLLAYKKVFETYLPYLLESERQLCLATQNKFILSINSINQRLPQTLSLSSIEISKDKLTKQYPELQGKEFQIEGYFYGGCLAEQKCIFYIIIEKINVHLKKLIILVMKRNRSGQGKNRKHYIEYGENCFIIRKPNTFYFKNKLLICGINKSIYVFFESTKDIQIFLSTIEVSRTIDTFPDTDIDYMPYEAKVYSYFVVFEVVGLLSHSKSRSDRYFCIKMKLCAFSDFAQILYLTKKQIVQIFEYLEYLHKGLKLTKEDFFNHQRDEINVMHLQQKMNYLVRTEYIRKKPEYLFDRLGVSEGVWILLQAQNYKRLQCKKEKVSLIDVKHLNQIVNYNVIVPKNIIPVSIVFHEQYQQLDINPFVWIIAAVSLHSLLYKIQSPSPNKYQERKTIVWEKLDYSHQIIYTFNSFKQVNQRMNPKFRAVPQTPLSIYIYDRWSEITTKTVYHEFHQDTVESILLRLGEVLEIDKLVEFALYGLRENRQYYLDRNEKIEKVVKAEFQIFIVKKMLKLPVKIQMELYQEGPQGTKKRNLVTGQLVSQVKTGKIVLSNSEKRSYLSYILGFHNESQLSINEISNVILRYLPSINSNDLQIALSLTSNISKPQDIGKAFIQFYDIFMAKDQWITDYFQCKIWLINQKVSSMALLNLNIDTNKQKYYSCEEIEIGVNFNLIKFKYPKPSSDFVQKRNNGQYSRYQQVPTEILHSDYTMGISGTAITLKIKNSNKQTQELYLICQDSLWLWRLLTFYRGVSTG